MNTLGLVVSVMLLSSPSSGEVAEPANVGAQAPELGASIPVEPAVAPGPVVRAESHTSAPVLFSSPRGVGVHFGIGPGTLAVDLRYDRFYGMLAFGGGTAVLSDGKYIPMTMWFGVPFLVDQSPTSAWYFDLGVIGGVTAQQVQSNVNYAPSADGTPLPAVPLQTAVGGGLGVGVGFRFEHVSGLTVGIKLPVFGANWGRDFSGTSLDSGLARVGYYFLMTLASVPVLSLGYRF